MNILITRPLLQAHATAAQLERMGFCPSILPLVEIIPLAFSIPVRDFDAVIATSANLFVAQGEEFVFYRHLPLFCVGEQTAIAAKENGFSNIVTMAEDVNRLVPSCKAHPAQHFLYLAGRPRRLVLEQTLSAQGKNITVVEAYCQQPLPPSTDDLAMMSACFDYVLFYSATTAQHANWLEMFFDPATKFLCLSPRIARALPEKFQAQAQSAPRPTESSLLSLLKARR